MLAPFLLGAAVGAVVGLAAKPKKKKAAEATSACLAAAGCGISEMSTWVGERNLDGLVVTTQADLGLFEITPSPDSVVITQDTCTVYSWDGTAWVVDPVRTADLAEYLRTGVAEIQARRAESGLPTPTLPDQGVPPPPGPREVPG